MVAAIARRIAIIIAITITLDINPITPFTMIVKIIAKAHTNIAGIKSNIEGIIYKKKSITDAIVKIGGLLKAFHSLLKFICY